MKTTVVTTAEEHYGIAGVQGEIRRRQFDITAPPTSETDIVCLCPTGGRVICFWTGTEPTCKPVFPAGTKVAVKRQD